MNLKNNPPSSPSHPWPSLAQAIRQVGLITLIVGVWSVMLFGYLRLFNHPSGANAVNKHGSETATHRTRMPKPTSFPLDKPRREAGLVHTVEPTFAPAHKSTVTSTSVVNSPLPQPLSQRERGVPPPSSSASRPDDQPNEVSFTSDVMPIFERRCVKCHGREKTEEGLLMRTYDEVMAGSDNGPVIEPGNVTDSYLVELIVKGKMPKKSPRLLPSEIRLISDWVAAGAPNN